MCAQIPGRRECYTSSVLLEWKEYGRNIDLYRLAACLEASSGDFHTLKLLGYVQDPDPRFGNPRIGLLYRCPADQDASSQFETLPDRLKRTRMSSSEILDLGSRFKLIHTLATAVYHLLLSGWLHKGLRSRNILLFQRTSLARPYLVGFDHSRPDHPKEASVRNEVVLEFDRYRHPSYLRNKDERNRPTARSASHRRSSIDASTSMANRSKRAPQSNSDASEDRGFEN